MFSLFDDVWSCSNRPITRQPRWRWSASAAVWRRRAQSTTSSATQLPPSLAPDSPKQSCPKVYQLAPFVPIDLMIIYSNVASWVALRRPCRFFPKIAFWSLILRICLCFFYDKNVDCVFIILAQKQKNENSNSLIVPKI